MPLANFNKLSPDALTASCSEVIINLYNFVRDAEGRGRLQSLKMGAF